MAQDLPAERIARRQLASSARAERLRQAVPAVARRLREKGATRVILFGSLASGAQPHEGTDIDLCVEGVSLIDAERASLDLAESVGAVDLVRWETAPEELRAVVERYGVLIEDE
jgi:predicted nucleotidyltransferase